MALIRESAGDLGARVRKALDHATSLWEETHPGTPETRQVGLEDDMFARALARRWAERGYSKLSYFHEVEKGGHFAAWEEPLLFASEMRAAFKSIR